MITTKVRIPAKAVAKLIGERGRNIADICRSSKTKIVIPKNEEQSESIIVNVTGTKENIKTAQYLMQKAIKGWLRKKYSTIVSVFLLYLKLTNILKQIFMVSLCMLRWLV